MPRRKDKCRVFFLPFFLIAGSVVGRAAAPHGPAVVFGVAGLQAEQAAERRRRIYPCLDRPGFSPVEVVDLSGDPSSTRNVIRRTGTLE